MKLIQKILLDREDGSEFLFITTDYCGPRVGFRFRYDLEGITLTFDDGYKFGTREIREIARLLTDAKLYELRAMQWGEFMLYPMSGMGNQIVCTDRVRKLDMVERDAYRCPHCGAHH
jgi:hypothetical protein